MKYSKLGDKVYVSGKIVRIIESTEGIAYEVEFEGGFFGWGDKVTIREKNIIQKADAVQ